MMIGLAPVVQVNETPPVVVSAVDAFAEIGSYDPNETGLVEMMQFALTLAVQVRSAGAAPPPRWGRRASRRWRGHRRQRS
jgi:hypothetical protein